MSSNTDGLQMSAEIQKLLSVRPLYQIRQNNGQRVYGPPIDGSMAKPYKGSEVCLKGIPNDCFEDKLVPFLETVGKIYRLRIAVNFSGKGRNFAFAEYGDPFTAQKAVLILNEKTCDTHIRIELSYDNKRLRIEDISAEQIDLFLGPIRAGLLEHNYDSNKRWLTLKYDSHHSASLARRKFLNNHTRAHSLEWVSPSEQLQEVTSIWIHNILLDKNLCLDFSFNRLHVQKVNKVSNNLVLIKYRSRMEAEEAFSLLLRISKRIGFEICWDFL